MGFRFRKSFKIAPGIRLNLMQPVAVLVMTIMWPPIHQLHAKLQAAQTVGTATQSVRPTFVLNVEQLFSQGI